MYQQPLNELSHSLQIRKCMIQGEHDFSDLTYGSHWSSEYYTSFSKRERIDKKIPQKDLSQVTYCPSCNIESIRELGYAYFKKVWWRSHWCRVHRKKLYFLTGKNKSLWEDIVCVLRGQEPLNFERFDNIDASSEHIKISSCYGELHIDFRENFSYPYCVRRKCIFQFSPCFQITFLKWCFSKHKKILSQISYGNGNRQFFSKFLVKPFIIDRYSLNKTDDYAYVFFNLLCREKPPIFIDFISNYVFYIEEQNILKNSNASCSKCPRLDWSRSCCLSKEIYRKRLLEPVMIFNGEESFRIGMDVFKVEDRSIELAQCCQIDSIYFMNNNRLCDFSDTMHSPKHRRAAKSMGVTNFDSSLISFQEQYLLLGYHDPELNDPESDIKKINLPIYLEENITLIPSEHRPMLLEVLPDDLQ